MKLLTIIHTTKIDLTRAQNRRKNCFLSHFHSTVLLPAEEGHTLSQQSLIIGVPQGTPACVLQPMTRSPGGLSYYQNNLLPSKAIMPQQVATMSPIPHLCPHGRWDPWKPGIPIDPWGKQDLPTGLEQLCFTSIAFFPTWAMQIRSLAQDPDYLFF